MNNDRVVVYYGREPFHGSLEDPEAVRLAAGLPGYGPPMRDMPPPGARSSRELGIALQEARRHPGSTEGDARFGGSVLDFASGLLNSSRSALQSARGSRAVPSVRGSSERLLAPSPVAEDESASAPLIGVQPEGSTPRHVAIRVPTTQPHAALRASAQLVPVGAAGALSATAVSGSVARPSGTSPAGRHFRPDHVAALNRVVDRVRLINRVKGVMQVGDAFRTCLLKNVVHMLCVLPPARSTPRRQRALPRLSESRERRAAAQAWGR